MNNFLISPHGLPSNDCIAMVLAYAFDRYQFERLVLRSLSHSCNTYFSKLSNLSQFLRPKRKVIINHNTDRRYMEEYLLPLISQLCDVKIHYNLNLSSPNRSDNAFEVIERFVTKYNNSIEGFTLNFQLFLICQ